MQPRAKWNATRRSLVGSALCLVLVAGCSRKAPPAAGAPDTTLAPQSGAQSAPRPTGGGAQSGPGASATRADGLRKIVQRATLELTVPSLPAAQAKATELAERAGGFVASAERTDSRDDDGRDEGSLALTLKVPAERFSSTLAELRTLSVGPSSERVSADDVTEEFIDVSARIHNQARLEQQFLEILKSASKVEDALGVQRELASVRTEIEKLEGRRRLLERDAALATISLAIVEARPLAAASFGDFGRAGTRAYADALSVGAGLVTAAIRATGVIVPVVLLVGLPGLLALRLLARFRRARSRVLPAAPEAR